MLAAFDAAFLIPAVTTFRQAWDAWSRFESLFDLVAAVFLSAWLTGWSIAPLLMTSILLLMLFGREVLTVRPGRVEIGIGLPLLGLTAVYDAAKMRNLRRVEPPPKSGTAWRGAHLAFDYGANATEFGSAIDAARAASLIRGIQAGTRSAIRSGEATSAEREGEWEPVPLLAESAEDAAAEEEVAWVNEPPSLTSLSALLLIAANLVPVAGAIFLGWELSDVMVLYWAESAIIGFYNLCKIILIGRWFALLAGPFFLGHFGGFMAVHFLFVYTLFVKGPGTFGGEPGGDLSEVWALFGDLWPALLALFLSHGYSFVTNFLGRQEYRRRTVSHQMGEPYGRIVFMHLVLIFGGFLVLLLGSPVPVLIAVIGLKVFLDLRAHIRQHGGKKAENGTQSN
ncbi:MAG: hypothetical protein EHM68_03100 [Lysobacterales bacterium]|nr:MAG: hypothetical protein EHM68_03100 [Xanthomonadales bacterium]